MDENLLLYSYSASRKLKNFSYGFLVHLNLRPIVTILRDFHVSKIRLKLAVESGKNYAILWNLNENYSKI